MKTLPVDQSTFLWADQAAAIVTNDGQNYRGGTSPWWSDSDAF